jgi:hypothetical protein
MALVPQHRGHAVQRARRERAHPRRRGAEAVQSVVEVSHHTNTVENFWRLFKAAIRSTHIHVSPKYMDRYLGEFTFRSNHREMRNAMFDLLIGAV